MKENTALATLLRERNLKATPTRIEVLGVISDYHQAIPFSKIQEALHNFDRVTLYRTIQALMKSGIIHKALVEKNETFYAICSQNCSSSHHTHNHIHFKCTACNAVTCVQPEQPIRFSIPGHAIDEFEIKATGICMTCR